MTEEIGRNLSHVGHLPTSQGFSTMKEDLAFKQGEMEKSKDTLEGVTREHSQLQVNLEKVKKYYYRILHTTISNLSLRAWVDRFLSTKEIYIQARPQNLALLVL